MLVKMNKSLREVELLICGVYDFYYGDNRFAEIEERLAIFTKCFFQAPLLESLQFIDDDYGLESKLEEIEEIYRTNFRHRAVHLKVMGVDY